MNPRLELFTEELYDLMEKYKVALMPHKRGVVVVEVTHVKKRELQQEIKELVNIIHILV